MAASPPARAGRASSRGKPPARGATLLGDVVVVDVLGEVPGTGVRKRNGVGVGSCWPTTCGSAYVSGPAATATATCTTRIVVRASAANTADRLAITVLVGISPPKSRPRMPILPRSERLVPPTRAFILLVSTM